MNDIFSLSSLGSARARRAWFVALASASLMTLSCGEAPAAWSPFSGWRKQADTEKKAASNDKKPVSDPKSAKGFNGSIRKLLSEAKAEEERGNLDRAISLADRANKVAETAAKVTKPAEDVSPIATARYANDLRLKKAELSVSRGRKSLPKATETARAADSPKTIMDVAYPDTSPVDTAAKPAPKPERKVVDTGSKKKSAVAELLEDDFEPLSEAPPPVREPVVTRSERSQSNLAIAKKAAPVALPVDSFGDEIFDEGLPSNKRDADRPLRPGQSAEASEDELAFFEDDDEQSTKVAQTASTRRDDEPSSKVVEPAPFKLRPRFDIRETADLKPVPARTEVQQVQNRGPVITPMDVSPADHAFFEEQDRLLTLAEKEAASTASTDEAPLSDELISAFDTEEGVAEEEQIAELRSDLRLSKRLDDEFPADKVRELQQRLDSAAALKPGAIPDFLSSTLIQEPADPADNELNSAIVAPIVKLRKPAQRMNDFRTSDPASVVGGEGARQVIGLTQMVTWQPAKAASRPVVTEAIIQPLPEDLRQSLRGAGPSDGSNDFAVSGSTIPKDSRIGRSAATTTTPDRSRLRGSLWDNATAPSPDGFSGSIGARSEHKETTSNPTIAPPPPTSEVKQTSFDSAHDLFHRDYGDRAETDAGSATTSADMKIASESKRPSGGRARRLDDQTDSTRAMLANGPIERVALLFGIPTKTASSILGAAGIVLLIAGLWTVRAVIRTEKR